MSSQNMKKREKEEEVAEESEIWEECAIEEVATEEPILPMILEEAPFEKTILLIFEEIRQTRPALEEDV